MSSTAPAVAVCCRVRPRNARADSEQGQDAFNLQNSAVYMREGTNRTAGYPFDKLFGPDSTQQDVFDSIAKPMVRAALEGFNATILSYGQTGSGKTHTMTGNRTDPGITPRIVDSVFQAIENSEDTLEFTIRMCYLEIYNERVRDLLNPETGASLTIRQDPSKGVFVEGACEEYVASADELMQLIRLGEVNRAVASTGMNDISSRSHSVVMITLEVKDTVSGGLQKSKLCLVDLAGSESVGKTHAEGQTLDEAKMINKSLFTLAKVINTLADIAEAAPPAPARAIAAGTSAADADLAAKKAQAYIPYRDSKLTRLLQDSLGGNARTALIVCCSPCTSNLTESLSTLRFAMRAKKMKNKPVVNRVRSVEELERLLAKAEMAIDAQQQVIQALTDQVTLLSNASPGGDDGEGGALTTAASNAAASSRGGHLLTDSAHTEGSETALRTEDGDDDPFPRTRHRSPRRNSGLDALSVAQLVELTSLREEVDRLRVQVATDAEELGEREEELKALQGVLEAKQQLIGRLLAEHDAAFAAAREQGASEAQRESLAGLRTYACSVCTSNPFSDLLDVQGVGVLHTALCFQLHESRASCSRVEERASVLQAELHDLKTFVSANQVQQQTRGGTSAVPGGHSEGLPRAADGEVVEVKVVQDLQGKLATLIHVHRQLLRKYAVVDVECGEMAEAVKARDERIGDLTKAQLSYNANVSSLKDQYDSRITELIKDHDEQLAALRSALSRAMPKPLTTSRRMAAGAGGGFGGGEDEARSTPSTPPASARVFGGSTFWDAPVAGHSDGAPVSASGGITHHGAYASPPLMTPGTTRSRHVVKPIRGQQADSQQHAPNPSNLSFSLLRTPRGGVAGGSSSSGDPAHRSPASAGGNGVPAAGRLTDITDGDEDDES